MNDKEKNSLKVAPASSGLADLELAFDVGHSSIGWAVLKTGKAVDLLGCGAVIFRADDCLASARRGFRRQRRHIRSTRQRIARMKVLLAHLGVLTMAQLDLPGCAWPWLLAARVLRGGELLSWRGLWDVLRWYAHNRGYDGNRRWSAAESEAASEDTEKEENAKALMDKYGVHTMAEAFCAMSGIDPLGAKKSANLPGDKRPKGQNAAFPRATVEGEVRRILQRHFGKLPKVDARLERALLGQDNRDKTAWQAIPCPDLKLPKRYEGALLFGQLVPRFDNRIIAQCPITGEKVPVKRSHEFLEFRWAMTLANIRIGFRGEKYENGADLRRLKAEELFRIDSRVRSLSFLKIEPDKPGKDGLVRPGKNELRNIVVEETKCDRHNLDALLLTPDARDALKLLPIKGEKKLPLEDVASIIITSFSASIHSNLFLEAAKLGVALIICESFKPVSLVVPANRSTDTILSRAMLNLTPRARAHLWQKTIDAKCQNQVSLAEHVAPTDAALPGLRETAFGKKPHKEAICAKMFWQIFGRSLNDEEFTRDRAKGGLNNFLNYGYAVLLSTVLQKLFGVGLDPTFGIGHVARERSTPLAYDLMEPFRPCVEWRVVQWVREHPNRSEWEVTKEFRKWVTGFPLERVEYLDLTLEIQGVIEGVVRGFRRAVVENQPRYYKPWTPKNSKWAG